MARSPGSNLGWSWDLARVTGIWHGAGGVRGARWVGGGAVARRGEVRGGAVSNHCELLRAGRSDSQLFVWTGVAVLECGTLG